MFYYQAVEGGRIAVAAQLPQRSYMLASQTNCTWHVSRRARFAHQYTVKNTLDKYKLYVRYGVLIIMGIVAHSEYICVPRLTSPIALSGRGTRSRDR